MKLGVSLIGRSPSSSLGYSEGGLIRLPKARLKLPAGFHIFLAALALTLHNLTKSLPLAI